MSNTCIIKLMKNKPTLSDNEIHSHKNFDKLLELYQQMPAKPLASSRWLPRSAYWASAVLLISTIVYYGSPKQKVGTSRDSAEENQATASQDSVSSLVESREQGEQSIQVKPKSTTVVNSKPLVESTLSIKKPDSPTIPVFKEAAPVNGYPDLYAYFERELKYPTDAPTDTIEGVVSVSFAISKNGKPIQIQITNSLGDVFDKECLRIIENMPPWYAASINGEATETRLSIPLTFRLKRKNQ